MASRKEREPQKAYNWPRKNKYEFGEQIYVCNECEDTGFIRVHIFGDAKNKAEEIYGKEKGSKQTIMVGCSFCDCPHRDCYTKYYPNKMRRFYD